LTLFIILGILAAVTDHPVTVYVTAGMSVLFLLLWIVMRRGFVNLASWCLLILLILGCTLILYFNGSIRVPAASAFVACVVVAGLTLGNRATIGSAIGLSAILFFLYRAEIAGLLPEVYYAQTGFLQWMTYAGVICITAVMLMLVRNNLLKALALARQNAAALAERNQDLQKEIAERQQAEQALRKSEERYRALFELESDAILLISTDNMNILDCNSAATELYGYARGELLAMNAAALSIEPDRIQQYATDDSQTIHIPQRFDRTKAGRVFPVEITGRYFDLQDKNLLLVAVRDITERVRAEESLREYREHLEDLVQERTAQLSYTNQELEAFSYSVAHDLRAPLRAINGFSKAILEEHAEHINPEMETYLTQVIRSGENMSQMLDALLSLSRVTLSEINLEQVNLSVMARAIMSDLQRSEPGRNVEIIIADDLTVIADRRLMQILLTNLLNNAWKFSSRRLQARIEVGKKEDGVTTYFVRDNGVGFDMAYVKNLFVVFQRLHAEKEYPGNGDRKSVV
jgi:PAS domain S-box-containing protein